MHPAHVAAVGASIGSSAVLAAAATEPRIEHIVALSPGRAYHGFDAITPAIGLGDRTFLAVVAVIPTVIADVMNIDMVVASFFGGTSLLIVVSVGLDLVQKIDSHLVMRNYKGLMEED